MALTFGNTSIVGGVAVAAGWWQFVQASPASSGSISSISATLRTDPGTNKFRGVIYSYDSSTTGTLLAYTDEVSYSNTADLLLTANFSGANIIDVVAGTNYWLGVIGSASAVQAYFRASATYALNYIAPSSAVTYGIPPSTISGVTSGGSYPYLSAYATYTPAPTLTGIQSITGLQSITL